MKLSNSKIMESYSKKRAMAQEAAAERKNAVYDMIPELKRIDDEISAISINVSRKLLSGNDPSSSASLKKELEDTISILKEGKLSLLRENGLPEDFLNVSYECSQCKDTGFLPNRSHCNCYKRQLTEILYDMSNISRVINLENLTTFDLDIFSKEIDKENGRSPRENMQEVLEIALEFIRGFDEKIRTNSCENLLFFGKPGVGKTFMCNAIAKEIIDRGHSVVYQTSFKIIDILEKIRFHSDKNSENSSEKMQLSLLNNSDLLIIDDLGSELINSFTNAELFNIINSRILNGKGVIISTNLTPTELMDKYPSRISSRLFGEFKIIKLYGNDLRWSKK